MMKGTKVVSSARPAARIGIGGPVGAGKTSLIERLIPKLDKRGVSLAIVTNDLVTEEDAESGGQFDHETDPFRRGRSEPTTVGDRPTSRVAGSSRATGTRPAARAPSTG